jgi:uncharacterized protein YoxC
VNKSTKSNNVAPALTDLSFTLKEMCQQMKQMSEKQTNFETKLTMPINSVSDSIDKQIASLRDDLCGEFLDRISRNEMDIAELQAMNSKVVKLT